MNPATKFEGAAVWTCADGSIRVALLRNPIPSNVADPAALRTWLDANGYVRLIALDASARPLPIADKSSGPLDCEGAVAGVGIAPGVVPPGINEIAVIEATRASFGVQGDPTAHGTILASPDGRWSGVVTAQSLSTDSSFPILGTGTITHKGPLQLILAPLAGQQACVVDLQASGGDWSLTPMGWTEDAEFYLVRGESLSTRATSLWLVHAPRQ